MANQHQIEGGGEVGGWEGEGRHGGRGRRGGGLVNIIAWVVSRQARLGRRRGVAYLVDGFLALGLVHGSDVDLLERVDPPGVHARGLGPGAYTRSHFRAQLEDLRDTSLTLELNLSTFGTHPRVKSGYMRDNASSSRAERGKVSSS